MPETASYYVDTLHLKPHPEGGFYREIYRSASSTAIYFLLEGDRFSAFHRIPSDELWHFYSGHPLIVHVIDPTGQYSEILLGSDPTQDEVFQAMVPAGHWFAASLKNPDTFALVGCTVAPPFEFATFEIAARRELAAEFPQHRNVIESLTRDGYAGRAGDDENRNFQHQ